MENRVLGGGDELLIHQPARMPQPRRPDILHTRLQILTSCGTLRMRLLLKLK